MFTRLIDTKIYYFISFLILIVSCYTPSKEVEGDKYPNVKTFDQVFKNNIIDTLSGNTTYYTANDYLIIIDNRNYSKDSFIIYKENKKMCSYAFNSNFNILEVLDDKLSVYSHEEILEINLNYNKIHKRTPIVWDIRSDPQDEYNYEVRYRRRSDSIAKIIKTIEYYGSIFNLKNFENSEREYLFEKKSNTPLYFENNQWFYLVNKNSNTPFYMERSYFFDTITYNTNKFTWIKNKTNPNEVIEKKNNQLSTEYDRAVVVNKKCSSGNHFIGSFGYCQDYIFYHEFKYKEKVYQFKFDVRKNLAPTFLELKNGIYSIYDKNLYYFPNQK